MGLAPYVLPLALLSFGACSSTSGNHGDASVDAGDSGDGTGGGDAGSGDAGNGGGDSGDSLSDGGADAAVVVVANAFYVATTGSDSNPGTMAAPFLTLTKAQSAMRASSTDKTTYVRSGIYTPASVANCYDSESCALNLGDQDNGETWSYYPPDGPGSAIIDGQASASNAGLYYIIATSDNSDVTIDGLTLRNFQYAGVVSGGGTMGLTVSNNFIYNGYYASTDDNPGGIAVYGGQNATFSHNVIHDIPSWGIATVGNASNLLVTGNFIYDTCTQSDDCSAIYHFDPAASSTNMRWTNNYVRDGNLHAPLDGSLGSALYADDCVSNLTMSGNIITGRNGYNTVFIHGGSNVHITGNITDLSTFQQSILDFQSSDGTGCADQAMIGNEYTSNIIIGAGGGGSYWLLDGTPQNAPIIQNNAYHNYGGAAIASNGDYTDSSPMSLDPQLSGWTYDIAAGSPVFNAPIDFPEIVGGWGPPGFVIPQSGSAPSSPH